MQRVVIIGAGISGLATAWWLHNKGCDVLVLEKDRHVGGTMKTLHDGGWLVETGPNSALETTPLFRTLFDELGLQDEVVYANKAANKRYILRNGQLHALPLSPLQFLQSKLWTLPGKLRLLKEPFIGRAQNEETIAQFVHRRLGQEFLDYAINPFVVGVYAGNPDELSIQAAFPKLYALEKQYGGLIKGQILGARERKKRAEKAKDRARMFSFKRGMQTLTESIAKALAGKIKTNVAVSRIKAAASSNGSGKMYEISAIENGQPITVSGHAVVVAIPAFHTAGLIEPFDSSLAQSLKNIYYPPVAEVYLGYNLSDVGRPLDGFGFLVPAKEHRKILGTIWSSSIFPERCPSGTVAFTTFVGGSRQPEIAAKSDSELIDVVTQELAKFLHTTGAPIYSKVTRWEKAIPQYRLGHLSVVDHMEQFEHNNPGMFLAGNFRGGISVGDCVASSHATAERVLQSLSMPRDVSTHVHS
ncbi:MAG: protoporphyrinogen oxidase [Ignavibacteriae bacterium]|nr:protoporphyrinogen oxidase [Ignavibacteriota bacterium]